MNDKQHEIYYPIANRIKELGKGFPRSQVYVLENKNWTVLLSTYPNDEFIRISNKNYCEHTYCRPNMINDLGARLYYAHFEEVLN